jgi:hypothetical protein
MEGEAPAEPCLPLRTLGGSGSTELAEVLALQGQEG